MILAIDIGGTKTLVAVFDDNKNIVEQIKFPTPKNYDEFLNEVKKTKESIKTTSLNYGAIGIRGLIDRNNGTLINDNILDWPNAPLTDDFSQIFGCNFVIENDTKLAGLSEATLVEGYKKVIYVTVSTGIGSALIIDKKIDKNFINSEVGKWIFEHDGKIQTWEDFAGGKAIYDKFGQKASEINNQSSWEQISVNLAFGLINISAAYNPELIIIGGGVGAHFDKFSDELNKAIKNMTPQSVIVPRVVGAKRSEEAVIYGCLELVLQEK